MRFNPHPHAEGDLNTHTLPILLPRFNPHPHAEGDSYSLGCQYFTNVSIHTLTRRVTKKQTAPGSKTSSFNPHPHAEGDDI